MIELTDLFDINVRHNKDITKDVYSLLPNAPDLQVITQISAANYERNECKDKNLVFIPSFENHNDSTIISDIGIYISSEINLEFTLEHVRLFRKMLHPIDKSHCLVFGQVNDNLYKVIGICSLDAVLNKYQCYVFTIKKRMKWYLKIGNVNSLGYDNGVFKSTSEIENNIDINETVSKINEHLNSLDRVCFQKIITDLVEQNHGTSLVIFESHLEAEKEAKRLASQTVGRGFLLQPPLKYNKEHITQITNIDGGLILDCRGNCYAYACIFDGTVPKSFDGNPSRGARYNSIKLYVKTQSNCVGVIYSDDETIDVISPNV